MRSKIYASLIFSLLLVFSAVWIRYAETPSREATLSLVDKPQETLPYNLLKTAPSAAGPNSPSPALLSNTELISRELFTDYAALSARGQVTGESLTQLANKYVDAIPSLAVAERLTYLNFKSVTNTKANLENYASAITKIYASYAQKLLAVQTGGNVSALFLSPTGETPLKMKTIYQDTAASLKALPVPSILLPTHLELTNLYLENASAMDSLSKIQADPATAFAGLLATKANVGEEAQLLIKIQQILTANGI